ncbi:hypothetical protein BCR37DRAFT_384460 [Protomyces lactucae-debilis]|uniref:Uncharacterized protein n=1 Tax=Protomyces lactucae-debilis TaxID=2754530 RepID=A0A1Y2ES26_PROLT|nr:uncharacterized protein BCR37DRAFT_384460 [Protomyces lactucae-debilis]ORY74349.1 hypothetical protein BCR37DRAFT_384460 [Protomyces lactucae-debilis]
MAGSCGLAGAAGAGVVTDDSTRRSFTSLPRKTIYSKTLSLAGISSAGSPFLPSVPKERTCSSETVEFCESISCKMPT